MRKTLNLTAAALLFGTTAFAGVSPQEIGAVDNPADYVRTEQNSRSRYAGEAFAAPPVESHYSTNACGANIVGQMGTCTTPDCATWSINQRIFRDGVAQGPACVGKACPGGGFGAGPFLYDAYYFNTNQDECECISVDYDNGACGTDVHGTLFEGVVDPGQTIGCTMLPDGNYLGDQGGSLATNDFSGSTLNEHITVVSHNNFASNACQYSFTISCIQSESLTCALAPIEAKLDILLLGGPSTGTSLR